MNRIQVSTIKRQASVILREKSPDYRKIILLHAAVTVAFLLLNALIGFFLNHAMADNHGLSGMGTTAVLKTAQYMLTLLGNILLPFWEIGILYVSIRAVRGQSIQFSQLTQGLRRYAVVIRYFLLLFLILMAGSILCSNVMMSITMFLPTPPSISSALNSVDPAAYTDMQALMDALMSALSQVPKTHLLLYFVPIGLFYISAYVTLLVLLSYRFKMSRYLLMDENPIRARKALGTSNRITKGEKANLFKLDLSFWWYYLLQLSVAFLVYIPDILAAMGVTLPISQSAANLLAYVVYCAVNLVLVWSVGAYYHTAMACAYETLKPQEEEQ